jgi:hypothetical protein
MRNLCRRDLEWFQRLLAGHPGNLTLGLVFIDSVTYLEHQVELNTLVSRSHDEAEQDTSSKDEASEVPTWLNHNRPSEYHVSEKTLIN